LGFVSSYSPIQDDGNSANSAGVPYYGMLAFATAVKGRNEILPTGLDAQALNLTAYVLGVGGKPRSIVVANRESSRDVDVSFKQLGVGTILQTLRL
jgi:hypothetical protein